MADYASSAAGLLASAAQFNRNATQATQDAKESITGALKSFIDREDNDLKIKREMDKEAEEQRRWDITNQREAEKHAAYQKEQQAKDDTKAALAGMAKVTGTNFNEGAGLLGTYAQQANEKADTAYNTAFNTAKAAGKSDDEAENVALDAYSGTRSNVAKDLFAKQQEELKYGNKLVDTSRDVLLNNLIQNGSGADKVAVGQSLDYLDKDTKAAQAANVNTLASELMTHIKNPADIKKVSKEFTTITGLPVPASFIVKANDRIETLADKKDFALFEHGLEKDKLRYAANLKGNEPKDPTAHLTDAGKAQFELNNLKTSVATNAENIKNINYAKSFLDPKSTDYAKLTAKANDLHGKNQILIQNYKALETAFDHKFSSDSDPDKSGGNFKFSSSTADKFKSYIPWPVNHNWIARDNSYLVDKFFADPTVRAKLESSGITAKTLATNLKTELARNKDLDLEDYLEAFGGVDL